MYTLEDAPIDLDQPFKNTEHVSTLMPIIIPKYVGNINDCFKCLGRRFINDNEDDIHSMIPCPECNTSGSLSILYIPVWGWKSLWDEEIYLSGYTIEYLDKIKKEEMNKHK